MEVRFGNLTVKQFVNKTNASINDDDIKWLEQHRIDSANFTDDDKFHIFDLPFGILAGKDIAEELIKRLKQYSFDKQFYVEGRA